MSTFAFESAMSFMSPRITLVVLGMLFSLLFGVFMAFVGNWVGTGIANCMNKKQTRSVAEANTKVMK